MWMSLLMWSCKQVLGPLSLLCPGTTLVSSPSVCFSPPWPQSHLTHHRSTCNLWGQCQCTAAHTAWIKPLPVQKSHCDSRQLPARLSHCSVCALTQGIWQVTMDLKAHPSSALGMVMLESLMWLTSRYSQGWYGPLLESFFIFMASCLLSPYVIFIGGSQIPDGHCDLKEESV